MQFAKLHSYFYKRLGQKNKISGGCQYNHLIENLPSFTKTRQSFREHRYLLVCCRPEHMCKHLLGTLVLILPEVRTRDCDICTFKINKPWRSPQRDTAGT